MPHFVANRLVAVCLALLGPSTAAQAGMPAGVGTVRVPVGMEARSTLLLLSGAAGWTDALETRAARLSQLHTLVIPIDTPAFVQGVGGDCAAAMALLAPLAARLRAEAGAVPRLPVLAGLGAGADLAVRAAVAAPERYKGLVTDGYGTEPGLCPGGPVTLGAKAPVRWLDIVAEGEASPVGGLAGVRPIRPVAGRDKAFYRSYLGVAGTDHAFDATTAETAAAVRDLPLTVHEDPGAPLTDTYAIFLSGDGGWANFDEKISDRLASAGVPVVGISSLRYMWQERPPARIAADITRLDRFYRTRFGRNRVLLIGFSLGANVTPFYVPLLPDDVRARLAGVALIAPESRTGFEIVIGGWLGRETGASEVAPAIAALTPVIAGERVACLHGAEESASPCPGAELPGLARLTFAGGHHLGHDHDGISAALLGLTTRQATPGADSPREVK